jgi:hypothetical protein
MIQGSGLKVYELGVRARDLVFRVHGLGFTI